MNEKSINISDKRVAFYGASIAVATAFFYSLMVMVYVIIRSSLTIYEILSSELRTSILLQNGISVAYSIAIFSILMAIFSSMIGALMAIVLKQSLLHFNPKFLNRKAKIISVITAILIASFIYFLLRFLLKDWMTIDNIEPFLFWFLIPGVLFLVVGIITGKKLNGILKNLDTQPHA